MNNSSTHGLSCFPNIENKFITWGNEINLYEIQSKTVSGQQSPASVPDDCSANYESNKIILTFLTSEDKYQYIRCVRPSFFDTAPVVAVGMSNGKVGICDFDANTLENYEYVPRQQRTCLCLAWNEIDKNILAMGHDRTRSDHCITIWDIRRGLNKESFNFIGFADTAHSICWDKSNKILITGISQKHIKMFDLRQPTATPSTIISTRLVNGVSISPGGQYLASYLDSTIGLWDLRNIDRPLTQIPAIKPISYISWCPTKQSALAAVQRGSPFLQVVDIYSTDVESGHDLYFTKKNFIPSQIKNSTTGATKINSIADFSWHPHTSERVLVLLENGIITDFNIPQRISLQWDNQNNLWLSSKLDTTTYEQLTMNPKFNVDANISHLDADDNVNDIANVMRQRALLDYGLNPDIKKNGDLAQSSNLKSVWNMLDNLFDQGIIGLKSVLGIDQNNSVEMSILQSEPQTLSWPEYIKNSNVLISYRNEARTRAQYLCGWKFENDMAIFQNKFIPELISRKEHTRAAMIAVFYLRINQACDILLKGTDNKSNDPSTLRMAAIALSSFDSDHSTIIWKQQQALASSQIRDPYLRTIFSFLTIENENFDIILLEDGISLPDRIAFACKYLSDIKLIEYIKLIIQKSIRSGDLNGLLLTGESIESTLILQAYIDLSFDIQTVSLLIIQFFHTDEITDYRVQYWISSYLDLLDSWGLWEKRAELEIKMSNFRNSTSKTARSVFLLCNFCGKSVSSALTDDIRMRNVSSNINKLSSCPHCRKPLPRCSLCLLHMGTPTGALSSSQDNGNLGWQSKPFSKWFSWCQTCRHGGHVEHLTQWFQKNIECPVTGCSCKCFDMDLPVPKFPKDITFN